MLQNIQNTQTTLQQKEAGGGAGVMETGQGKPVFAFRVEVPNAMPLAIGGMLGRTEDKKLNIELRRKLRDELRRYKLFYGVWMREILVKGTLAWIWTGLWWGDWGKMWRFTDFGVVDAWVDRAVLTELGKEGDGRGSIAEV
jgi:hypothetical protein